MELSMKGFQMRQAFVSAFFLLGALVAGTAAYAAPGAFAGFPGDWEGDGMIRFGDGSKERLKCKVNYTVPNESAEDLGINFSCKSDNYAFELTGNADSDADGALTGQWKESSRNFGGTVIGKVQGERIRLHISSSGFSATLLLTTKDNRQTVNIESGGGGEEATATITLRRK
jgi:hypothetical protein